MRADEEGTIAIRKRSIFLTTLLSLSLVLIVVLSGVVIKRYVSDAFEASQRIHELRFEAQRALRIQLVQEAGLRGYAVTGDRDFLDPYLVSEAALAQEMKALDVATNSDGLQAARAPLADASVAHAEWRDMVAARVAADPRKNGRPAAFVGKTLTDRLQVDFDAVDDIVRLRQLALSRNVQAGIDRINLLLLIVVAVFVGVALLFARQQLRSKAKFERQERNAQDGRRLRAELVAAFEAEKRVADTLQEAFTGRTLPIMPSLEFSASYVSAEKDTAIGGDWYDAMALPGSRVLFSIGDATGHGIEAAVTMNRTRQAVVSSALLDPDPAGILERVNLEIKGKEQRLATAIVGVADSLKYEFRYAAAGHPPPILLEPDRPPRFLPCGSVPLGAFSNVAYKTERVQTVPGATLILYTDGVLEHSRNVEKGEELLLTAIALAREQGKGDAASFIHQAIFRDRKALDDVAILTVGFTTGKAVVTPADHKVALTFSEGAAW